MKDGHALIADHNKRVDLILGIIFLFFAPCSLSYLLAAREFFHDGMPVYGMAFIILCLLSLGFFLWLGLWYLIAIFRKEPALVIAEEGIYDNSEPWSPGLIRWSEIKSIRQRQILFWKVIIIELENREGIISRQRNLLKKKLFSITVFPFGAKHEVYIRKNVLTNPAIASMLSHVEIGHKPKLQLPGKQAGRYADASRESAQMTNRH